MTAWWDELNADARARADQQYVDQSIRIHEAGHAVVARYFGAVDVHTYYVPGGRHGTVGQTTQGWPAKAWTVERNGVVALAGIAAVDNSAFEEYDLATGDSDRLKATAAATILAREGKYRTVEAAFEALYWQARTLCHELRGELQGVAALLGTNLRLGAAEVDAAMAAGRERQSILNLPPSRKPATRHAPRAPRRYPIGSIPRFL